jgi:hypothetical protein
VLIPQDRTIFFAAPERRQSAAATALHQLPSKSMRPGKTTPIGTVLWLLSILCWPSLLQAQESPEIALTRAERDWLAANPEILLGSDAHWRPYVWRRDDGTQAGIETDLIARIPGGLPGRI